MPKTISFERIVPDMSVLVDGSLSQKIGKEISVDEIIIHDALLLMLEQLVKNNVVSGMLGLQEIKKIKHLCEDTGIEMKYGGRKPSLHELRYLTKNEICSLIRELAYDEDAVLITADNNEAELAQAKSIKCFLIEKKAAKTRIQLEKYFDKDVMSVHLRENLEPFVKRGTPGEWRFEKTGNAKLKREEIQKIAQEIIERTTVQSNGFIEIERPGSTIVQLGKYRIVITKPPFSDAWEITAVRPVKLLNIRDYNLSEKLLNRLVEQAEGILIAGAPGMGKSTFAQALAEFYASMDKVVKTVEAPRDLILDEKITQYAISHGDAQEVHDILLLSRPDNTIFDEMRNTADFMLFADLRLAGIGLTGVVHATNPIDAIQRFVGRIDLGVIPQVVDTVIFINKGKVAKVLSLRMSVKVPSGMTESDLARPVVEVNDFETGKLEYELYTYGEETVIVPVSATQKSIMQKLAEESLNSRFKKYSKKARVEVLDNKSCRVYVPESKMSSIIGRGGKKIKEIEQELGMSIDVRSLDELKEPPCRKDSLEYSYNLTKTGIQISLDPKLRNKSIDIFVGEDYLLTAHVSKKGIIKIKKNNKIGRILLDALENKDDVILKKSNT